MWKEEKLKYRVIERFRGKYRIEAICSTLNVPRSGYYAWRKWMKREAKDQWLADLITECQQKSHYTYGFRRVQLWLEREKGKHVNHKAVLRGMRNLNLLSQVRRRRPYTHYKQCVHKCENKLNRQFTQEHPNHFGVTDITYIPVSGHMLTCVRCWSCADEPFFHIESAMI